MSWCTMYGAWSDSLEALLNGNRAVKKAVREID
jgi:hypothetical protein